MAQPPRQISFFITPPDITGLLAALEAERPVRYVLAGSFEVSTAIPEFESFGAIPSLGRALTGDQALEPTYLVLNRRLAARSRLVRQRNGSERVVIDQLHNPESVALRHGGLFAPAIVIAGSVGTSSRNEVSLSLMSNFKDRMEEQFQRIQSFYVGAGAQEMFRGGARLTASVKAPTEFDLTPHAKSR